MSKERKFCVDCKHSMAEDMPSGSYASAKMGNKIKYYSCSHPMILNLVNKEPEFCTIARSQNGLCTEEAKYYEPKKRSKK